MKDKTLIFVLALLAVLVGVLTVGLFSMDNISEDEVNTIVTAAVANISVPNASEIASLITITEVVVDEDIRMDEFLKRKFSTEYDEIIDAADEDSLDEIEDKDYKVIEEYIESIVFDFDEITDVDLRDDECNVILLGLEDDDDKSGECVYEYKVYYDTLTEDDVKVILTITSLVTYDEGDLNEEEVELLIA